MFLFAEFIYFSTHTGKIFLLFLKSVAAHMQKLSSTMECKAFSTFLLSGNFFTCLSHLPFLEIKNTS